MPVARGRAPARSGPRHPVVLVSLAAVAVYALTEALVARSVANDSWWRVEWVRLHVRFAHPAAAYGRPLPRPGWADWLPGTVSAVLVVAALTVLALLLAGSGRGWWLLVVAVLPLVPVELAPGVWAPPLPNPAAYGLVWLPGALRPATQWAWVAAGVAALTIAVPAAALHSSRVDWRPRLRTGLALRALVVPALAAAAVLWWEEAAGRWPDVRPLVWLTVLATVGALVVTGGLRRPRRPLPRVVVVAAALAVLPMLAAGAATWTAAVVGHPTWTFDASTRVYSLAALFGAAWVLAEPMVTRGARRAWVAWRAMVVADVAARSTVRVGPSPAAPAPAGGRHRA